MRQDVIRLAEERGVAAVTYTDMVETIFAKAQQFISNCFKLGILKYGNTLTYTAPSDILSKVDFVENFSMQIHVKELGKDAGTPFMNNGGSLSTTYMKHLVNGKIFNAEINIYCTSNNGVIVEGEYKENVVHEINHLCDQYFRLLNGSSDDGYVVSSKLAHIGLDNNAVYSDNEYYNSIIKTIIYRIISDTEFNALAAEIYGDLDGIKSKRGNFQSDLKNTVPYKIYSTIKKHYEPAIQSMTDEQTRFLMCNLAKHSFTLKTNKTDVFKKRLIEMVRKRLDKLIYKIGLAASCWYDRSEDRFDDSLLTEVITIIDKPNNIV